MTFIDVLIIYLACGSPIGVHQILDHKGPRTTNGWALIVGSFLLWPLFGIALISERFTKNGFRDLSISTHLIEQSRYEIETLAHLNESTISLFEFRDVYYRYTSLSLAVNSSSNTNGNNEIFKIDGNKDTALAQRCTDRRNRRKLAYQQARTRTEFVDLILNFSAATESAELPCIALKLTAHLNDPEASNQIMTAHGQGVTTATTSLSLSVLTLPAPALSKLRTLDSALK